MGIFEVVISIGMLIGMISSSYIFNAVDYIGVFGIAAGSYIVALIYTIFILDESLSDVETEVGMLQSYTIEQIIICCYDHIFVLNTM